MSGRKTRIRGGIPIAMEIILLMLPILLGSGLHLQYILNYVICSYEMPHYSLVMQQVLATEAERLKGLESEAGAEGIDIRAEHIEVVDQLARNITFSPPLDFCLSRQEKLERRKPVTLAMAARDRGEPVKVLDETGEHLVDLDMESEIGKAVEEALSVQKVVERVFEDRKSRTRAMFFMLPISKPVRYGSLPICRGGEGSALVLCASIPEDETEKNFTRQTMFATSIGMIGMCLILAVLCSMLYRELSALTPIRKSLEAAAEGRREENWKDIQNALKRTKTPELADLLESFQLMSESSKEYQSSVSSITELYDPILPKTLLDWFGKSDIREISHGDRALVTGTAMLLTFEDIPGAEISFPARNILISRAVDAIMDNGGIVTSLEYRHVLAMFPGDSKDAIEAAEDVLSLKKEKSGISRVLVSCHRGTIPFTMVGTKECMMVRMDLENYGILLELMALQKELKLGPLCTELTAEDSAATRRLWALPDGRRAVELILGDGREEELKQETREMFEDAVDAFDSGKYRRAADGFMSVLRVNRRDPAAAYYLELCEEKERA